MPIVGILEEPVQARRERLSHNGLTRTGYPHNDDDHRSVPYYRLLPSPSNRCRMHLADVIDVPMGDSKGRLLRCFCGATDTLITKSGRESVGTWLVATLMLRRHGCNETIVPPGGADRRNGGLPSQTAGQDLYWPL